MNVGPLFLASHPFDIVDVDAGGRCRPVTHQVLQHVCRKVVDIAVGEPKPQPVERARELDSRRYLKLSEVAVKR